MLEKKEVGILYVRGVSKQIIKQIKKIAKETNHSQAEVIEDMVVDYIRRGNDDNSNDTRLPSTPSTF